MLTAASHQKIMDRLRAVSAPGPMRPWHPIPWGAADNPQRITGGGLGTDPQHNIFRDARHSAIARIRRQRAASRVKAAQRPFKPISDKAMRAIQRRQKFAQHRIEEGFVHDGGTNSHVPKGADWGIWHYFTEKGFRSSQSASAQHWLTLFPNPTPPRTFKNGKSFPGRAIHVGDDKTAIRLEYNKMKAMDCAYLQMDMQRWGHLIVDLDRFFRSEGELRALLLAALGAAMMPNFIVFSTLPDGSIRHPHLIWLLPPGSAVYNNPYHRIVKADGTVVESGDKRCKIGIIKLYHTVHRGLIHRLLPLGADVGQLANKFKCKNPLSPWWSTIIATETWRPLSRLRAGVIDVSESFLIRESDRLKREAREATGEEPAGGSCNLWNLVKKWVSDVLVTGHRLQPSDYRRALEGDLSGWVEGEVTAKAVAKFGDTDDKLRDMIRTQAEFSATRWSATSPFSKDRGRDAAEIHEIAKIRGRWLKPKERMAIGGHNTRMLQMNQSIEIVARVIGVIVPDGHDPRDYRPAIVARCVGTVGKSTVYKVWTEALIFLAGNSAMGSSRYIEPTSIAASISTSDHPSGSEPIIASPSFEPAIQSFDPCYRESDNPLLPVPEHTNCSTPAQGVDDCKTGDRPMNALLLHIQQPRKPNGETPATAAKEACERSSPWNATGIHGLPPSSVTAARHPGSPISRGIGDVDCDKVLMCLAAISKPVLRTTDAQGIRPADVGDAKSQWGSPVQQSGDSQAVEIIGR